MRFKQFKPRPITEAILQQLDELRMNPTTLQQFAGSDAAKGIMAGFEAELVFTGLGGEGDYDEDPEPDYDADERCRSIQRVIEFFENDEYGYGTYGRAAERLQEELDEKYYEWHDEQMYNAFRDEQEDLIKKAIEEDDFDWGDEIRKQLNMMELSASEIKEAIKQGTKAPTFNRSSEQQAYAETHPGYQRYLEAREQAEGLLDDLVQDSISSQDKHYDYALDEFRDGFYIDDDSGFFDDVGLRYMSDVAEAFELMWPIMSYTGRSSEGGFDESNAERLADDLHEKLGVKTKVSSGYHSAKRDDVTWIFEPDSSLDADDSDNMPVEIVSPPMPLLTCLEMIENFFTWAEENGAYANSSTGFHMGVSLPHRGGDVDYVKLALFLGDEHVLKEFGRQGNHFCEAAMKKIRNRVKGNKEAVAGALDLMKHNLIELAQKALEINNHGFGKYTSINPQGGNDNTNPAKEKGAKYIEFRSAGGSNYFEDIDKLKNTLLRYAQAMTIAANPAAERKEYYKKLYKLIAPVEGDPAIDLFARFATGAISSEELKKTWAEKQLESEPKGDWVLYDEQGKRVPGETYHGYTKSDAWEKAWKNNAPGATLKGFQAAYKLLPSQSETGDWEVYNHETGETLEILHGYETKGAAADAVYDKYSSQNIPFNIRPADAEKPEKPLSQREKLAKNIKSAPAEPIKNWKVYDKKTGEVHYEQEGRKSSLVQAMRSFERGHKLPMGQLAIEEIPAKEKQNWDVVYKPTGRVVDSILGVDKDEAEQLLSKVARQHNFNNTDDLELKSQDSKEDPNKVLRTWEIVDRMDNNKVLDTVGGTTDEAERVRQTWVQRAGRGVDTNIGKRTVPTDSSAERARANQQPRHTPTAPDDIPPQAGNTKKFRIADAEGNVYGPYIGNAEKAQRELSYLESDYPNAELTIQWWGEDIRPEGQAPQGMLTQRPATGDYYEVRSGDRVYGYVSTQATSDNTRSIAIEVKTYINELTGRADAQLIYKSGDPVQATAPNGVPMWQVYERDSGNVVHEFADHDQTSAWATGQGWVRDVGAEDPSLFSVRPKMEA